MKQTLLLKILLIYLLFGGLSLIILFTYTQNNTINQLRETESYTLYREASVIATDYASRYTSGEQSLTDLQNSLTSIANCSSSDIWLIDTKGEVLLKTSDSSIAENALQGKTKQIKEFNIKDFGEEYYVIGDFYNEFDQTTLTVYYPYTDGFHVSGYVLVHKSFSYTALSINSHMNIAFKTFGLIFLCSSLFLFGIIIFMYIPIHKITKATLKYVKGDYSEKINIRPRDELGHLANTLNYMAEEMNTFDENQRKFISNVSHDFRSPLTSIIGYAQAMLDGTIPYEMQEKYLNIILFESERLTKLTKSLLDLNQFSPNGMLLDISDFDIHSMIQKTIITFEGRCLEKDLNIDLILTGDSLFVAADVNKIQQVLYNLIDNAIKFSHKNSSIQIKTQIRSEKVHISIKDSGIGIAHDSIKKIWDRFYKTDSSRGKDKTGTGLGLAIVKEIVQAHNENIDVVSTEGAGTTFTFTLPLSNEEKKSL